VTVCFPGIRVQPSWEKNGEGKEPYYNYSFDEDKYTGQRRSGAKVCWRRQGMSLSRSRHLRKTRRTQGCQIFLDTIYQNVPNYHNITKWPKKFQVTIKYTNIFHCKALQNLPKLGFLVWKYMYHLATLDGRRTYENFGPKGTNTEWKRMLSGGRPEL
jgi:hypothetical protein